MKPKLVITFLICLCLVVCFPSPARAGKDYAADRYDVLVDIQSDGSLLVTETIVFRFMGGPFTYVFRELPLNRMDGLEVLEVRMDGLRLPNGVEAGQAEIVGQNPIRVTWHFAPVSDSTHEFVLRYRVTGALQTDSEGDLLRWMAIPSEHEYPIAAALVSLTYPADVRPSEAPALDREFRAFMLQNGVRLQAGTLAANDSLILTARFPAGSLVSAPPNWQIREQRKSANIRDALLFGLGAALLIFFGGLSAIVLAARSFRRENDTSMDAMQKVTILPREIPPALAGRLVGANTAFLGTLFDLARRGVLQFEEGPKQWGSRTFKVLLKSAQGDLQPHERIFLEELFKKKTVVPLWKIASLAASRRFNRSLDAELTSAGWRDPERVARRNTFLLAAGLGLAGGIILFVIGLAMFGVSLTAENGLLALGTILMISGAALTAMGLLGLLVASLTSTLSDEGERQANAWKRFNKYLHSITRGQAGSPQTALFEQYLSYAAAYGILSEWGEYFSKMGNVPVPPWLQGLYSSSGDDGFATVIAVITAVDSSATYAGGGADGGASGGGASGAG